MFLFLRLLLAHFIGDFPLQITAIYHLKLRNLAGGIPHVLIIGTCMALLSWPYWHVPLVWGFILAVTFIHLVQDLMKIRAGIKHRFGFWFYLLDQLFHVGTLALLFLTPLKKLPVPAVPRDNILLQLYHSDIICLYAIALIIATYNGFHLIRNFNATFLGTPGTYSRFEKWYGMLERALFVTLCATRGPILFLLPLVVLGRPAIQKFSSPQKVRLNRHFVAPAEVILSWTIAVVTGLALRAAIFSSF